MFTDQLNELAFIILPFAKKLIHIYIYIKYY